VVPCAVCIMHMKTRSMGFLVEPQKHGLQFVVFSSLASKLVAQVSRFGPQNRQLWCGDLGLKIIATVSWFGPQNQAGSDLSVASQNRRWENGVGHTSRSSVLLCLEANFTKVFQSGFKTGGGVMTGGAHGTIMEVASGSN
jgi:hypothetical protein